MSTIQNNEQIVRQALDRLNPTATPDIDLALRHHAVRRSTGAGAAVSPAPGIISWLRRPAALLPLAAAAVLALSLTVAPLRSAAAQFLTIFRVQDITPVTITSPSQPLPDLSQLGDMERAPASSAITKVDSLAAASSAAGFTVAAPSALPHGVVTTPSAIAVTPAQTVGFTFRAAKAKAYLASTGHANVALPAKFDGASLQLHIQPGVILIYLPPGAALPSNSPSGAQEPRSAANEGNAAFAVLNGGVAFAEAKSPSVDASGVSAGELRDFLLSLPGLPPATVAQLKAIGDWSTTLPIPVPPGASLRKINIGGAPAVSGTTMGQRVVIWVRNGMVYGAAGGQASETDLLNLAASVK